MTTAAKPEKTDTEPARPAASQKAPSPDREAHPGESDGGRLLRTRVEAVLFSMDKPISGMKLAQGLAAGLADSGDDAEGREDRKNTYSSGDAPDGASIDRAVAELNEEYARHGRAFRIEQVAGGYRVMTLPEHAPVVGAFHRARAPARLSKPALETLAIIAYRQPITRADLEAIRGVSCGEVLKSLLEKRLIAITGRAEVLGRPMLYGTTKAFLDVFGLRSTKDLPPPGEFLPTD